MQYIFYLIEISLQENLNSIILSLILFSLSNFLFHVFLIFINNSNELFWGSLLKSTKKYAFYIIIMEITLGTLFGTLHVHMLNLRLDLYNSFIFYLFLFSYRSILLIISCIIIFYSMKNSGAMKNTVTKTKFIICFMFFIPYFYLKNIIYGIEITLNSLLR